MGASGASVPVEVRVEDGVAVVTLQRPERLNAFDPPMVRAIRAVVADLAVDDGVRAVVVTGAGRGFCAGLDLADIDVDGPPEAFGAWVGAFMRDELNPLVLELSGLGKPVVTAVNGVAAGGGVGLALAGDLVVAARSATFRVVFTPALGIVPDTGTTWWLPQLVGRARARGLALLGEPLDASTACEWGLVWEVVDDDAVVATAVALARRVAATTPAVWPFVKAALDGAGAGDLATQLDAEADANEVLTGTTAFADRVQAFRNRSR